MLGMIGLGKIAQVHARMFFKYNNKIDVILVRSQENINKANLFFDWIND